MELMRAHVRTWGAVSGGLASQASMGVTRCVRALSGRVCAGRSGRDVRTAAVVVDVCRAARYCGERKGETPQAQSSEVERAVCATRSGPRTGRIGRVGMRVSIGRHASPRIGRESPRPRELKIVTDNRDLGRSPINSARQRALASAPPTSGGRMNERGRGTRHSSASALTTQTLHTLDG